MTTSDIKDNDRRAPDDGDAPTARSAKPVESRESAERLRAELETVQSELDEAQRELEKAEHRRQRQLAEYSAETRRLRQANSALTVGLRQVRGDLERVAVSRAWRYGYTLTRLLARLAGRRRSGHSALASGIARIERIESATQMVPDPDENEGRAPPHAAFSRSPSSPSPSPSSTSTAPALEATLDQRAHARRQQLAQLVRERLGPVQEREHWPTVSAIVPTHNGRHHLERLFAGLTEHTDYPALEVVVIDNASQDGTRAFLRDLRLPLQLHVLESEENLTFSAANARGAARASGELLLLLNNDVEPFEPGWLKELVRALDTRGIEAVGATLLRAEETDVRGGRGPDIADREWSPIVQHRTIRFRWQDGMVKAFNSGDGEYLSAGAFGSELRAPAVTAACMLIGRDTFARVGGFDASYRYGTEDVDLGLKLLESGGESAGVGRALLVHHESSSQSRASRDFRRLNRSENRRVFQERWGARMRREYRLARLNRDAWWTDGRGPHIAIASSGLEAAEEWGDQRYGRELGEALSARGWRVTYVQGNGDQRHELPDDLEYVLSLTDPFDLRRVANHVMRIAWIGSRTERWLEHPWFACADVLLASSAGAAELIEARTGRRAIHFPLAVNPARFDPVPVDELLDALGAGTLDDERRRNALVGGYPETVLTRHTYAHRATELERVLADHEHRLSFCMKIAAPNRAVAPLWGDTHFAQSLLDELRRRGHRGCAQTLDEWEDESGLTYDVVIHLKGRGHYYPKPGQLNVLWSISHPEELTGAECDGYDLVCVASPRFAAELSERTVTPVVVLEQAADRWRMWPDPRPAVAHDLAYVANSRGVLRPIARELLPTDHDLAIWGTRWEGLIDTSHVVAEHVPNDELRHVYSSAGIVLNDHWDDMRAHGYISNRIYDALACGALVVSDDVPGISDRFGDAVVCYRSPRELRELIDRFLAEPDERQRRGEIGRAAVLAGHTFAHRVDDLLAAVGRRSGELGHFKPLRAAAAGPHTR